MSSYKSESKQHCGFSWQQREAGCRPGADAACDAPPSQRAGDDFLHDFAGAAVDALHAGVGIHARDHVFVHEAVAAVQLHQLVEHAALRFRAPELGHGGRGRVQRAGHELLHAAVDEGAAHGDGGGHLGQLEAGVLHVGDGLAEGAALAHVGQGGLVCALHAGQCRQADDQALVGQVAHELVEALALAPAQQGVLRHGHIVEEEFAGVLGLHAHLVEHAPHAKARAVLGFYDEDGGAARALAGIGLADHEDEAGQESVGDEGLAAVDAVVVALAFGARAHALQVRSRTGLGHGDGADPLAARHGGQVLALLRLGAVVEQVVGHDGVHGVAHAGQAPARHLLVDHGLVAEVATASAVFLGNVGAQQAQLAGPAPDRVADVALLAGGLVLRLHFGCDEAHGGGAQAAQVGVAPGAREGSQCFFEAGGARRTGLLGRAARKARRGRGLQHAAGFGEGGARAVVGMLRGLVPVEHGREAGVAAFEQLAPLVTRAGAEHVGQAQLEQGPARGIHLAVEQRILDAAALAQFGIELGLDGADGDVLAVGAGIGVVEGGAAVEHVLAALVAPLALGLEAVHEGRQQGRAVGHGRVDDLAPAAAPGLVQRGQQAHGQQHAAAAEVAHVVQRRHGRLARAADGVQRAGEGDVVDVVPRRMRQRAMLAPARHAAVDQARVAFQAGPGPQAQALHDAGPKALDQQVGARDQGHGGGLALLAAQVDLDLAAAARGDVLCIDRRAGPRDAQHLGAQVGQQHGAERPRAQARELDHANALKRSCHGNFLSSKARELMVAVQLAQAGFQQLAGGRVRQLGHLHHVVGQPPFGDARGQEVAHGFARHGLPGARHHQQQRALLPLGVGHADDGGLGHGRVAHGGVLHVDGGDPFAARLDHVLGAVHELQEAVRIDGGHVARGEEAFRVHGRAALALEVAVGDPGAAHAQVARALPDSCLGTACLTHADGAGLGHAPALHDLGAELVLEALQHGARHGRAADPDALDAQGARVDLGMGIQVLEQHQPHGGHALREGDFLIAHEFVDALPVQVRAGQHQPGPCHGRRIGRAPGVGVEHGHDEHHGLARVQPEGVGRQFHQRMQHGGTVRVQHALGVARGARGVAQRGGRALVELGPFEILALAADQLVPAAQVGQFRAALLACASMQTYGVTVFGGGRVARSGGGGGVGGKGGGRR
ncbi:hypothetical protein FQR65_LT20784 [Abscondita terminalis]|nr:hypothetical protein FQR65_LT20784 [Abscondita terminalis]